MHNCNYIKATDMPAQLILENDVKIKKKEDDRYTVTNESSTYDKKEKLRAAKGIISALIFCIPFWLLFMKFVLRLF
jgi:hypothetical protein